MSRNIIFVDLDRTLFRTDECLPLIWRLLAQKYKVDYSHQISLIPEWYRSNDDLRYYHLFGHIEAVINRPAKEVVEQLRPALTKANLIYPDATEAIAWQQQGHEVRILTYGEPLFQQYKYSLAPLLRTIPIDVTLTAKGKHIAAYYPGATGIMVDDKRNPGLPRGVREIWLNRAKDSPIVKEDGIIVINSLKSIQEVL